VLRKTHSSIPRHLQDILERMFRPEWYTHHYSDTRRSRGGPWNHFSAYGFAEGRSPNPLFIPSWYRRTCPANLHRDDVLIEHFITSAPDTRGDANPLLTSPWTREISGSDQNAILLALENPDFDYSLLFDVGHYRKQVTDLHGLTALEHFLAYGDADGASPNPLFDPPHYQSQLGTPAREPFLHYSTEGGYWGLDPHPDLSGHIYCSHYPEIAVGELTPLAHFASEAIIGLNPWAPLGTPELARRFLESDNGRAAAYLLRILNERQFRIPFKGIELQATLTIPDHAEAVVQPGYPGAIIPSRNLLIVSEIPPAPSSRVVIDAHSLATTVALPRRECAIESARLLLSPQNVDVAVRGSSASASGGVHDADAQVRADVAIRIQSAEIAVSCRPDLAAGAAISGRKASVQPPSLGFVIPCFNQEDFIGMTIASALNQIPAPSEIIVVDDGSSDGSAAIIDGFASEGVRRITIPNSGTSAAVNRGVREMASDLVAFTGGDDVICTGRTAHDLDYLADPALDAVIGLPIPIDADGRPIGRESTPQFNFLDVSLDEPRILRRLWEEGNFLCAPAATVRRSTFLEVGGYAEASLQIQDFILWIQFAGRKSVLLSSAETVQYRRFTSNTSLSSPANNRRMLSELVWTYRHFFEWCSDERILDAFSDQRDGNAKLERQIDLPILYLNHWSDTTRRIGLELLYDLATEGTAMALLEERHGIDLQEIFRLGATMDINGEDAIRPCLEQLGQRAPWALKFEAED
jgi:glycosyltransferase involved in cell wall biosynthesis